ncbi:DUF4442 domain-containing protein [Flavobacterium sp.]|uniref:DUF4442 domain-containing protein n=1 Tax=Flavobacterium sp. TaxID=239 RepID=UPI002628CB40|nr:DUF4442 domain-containing protein [Flavobacterium sp.]
MNMSAFKTNLFLFLKLPAAFWCGVRLKNINQLQCITSVRHRWFNQNPFESMYFAVQAMAAELSTGALVMQSIQQSGQKISMLVANNKGNYTKKATGRITFTCHDGQKVKEAIRKAIATGEGQTVWMKSIGTNEKGEQVSELDFEWTLKIKS